LTFDYEEARKPGKTEAPAEFAEKCRNGFHHRDTEDTGVEGFFVCRRGTDRQKGSALPRSGGWVGQSHLLHQGRICDILICRVTNNLTVIRIQGGISYVKYPAGNYS